MLFYNNWKQFSTEVRFSEKMVTSLQKKKHLFSNINIESYVTHLEAVADHGDKKPDTEDIETVVLPQESSISWDTDTDETDENEFKEHTPTSLAEHIELHRQHSHRAANDKANAYFLARINGQNVTVDKKNS